NAAGLNEAFSVITLVFVLSLYPFMHRFFRIIALGIALSSTLLRAGDLTITSADHSGRLVWSNAFPAGVLTVETANVVTGRWSVGRQVFTSNSVGAATAPLSPSNTF